MTNRHPSWGLLNQLNREINDLFGGTEIETPASGGWIPRADIKEAPESFTIEVDLPGVERDNIRIDMDNGVLTIQGERHGDTGAGMRRERVFGSFLRRFSLPDTADAENITARTRHGVLAVTIPKQKRVLSRRIEVNG